MSKNNDHDHDETGLKRRELLQRGGVTVGALTIGGSAVSGQGAAQERGPPPGVRSKRAEKNQCVYYAETEYYRESPACPAGCRDYVQIGGMAHSAEGEWATLRLTVYGKRCDGKPFTKTVTSRGKGCEQDLSLDRVRSQNVNKITAQGCYCPPYAFDWD